MVCPHHLRVEVSRTEMNGRKLLIFMDIDEQSGYKKIPKLMCASDFYTLFA